MEETEALVNQLQRFTNNPMDIQHLLTKSVSNVICKVAFGKRFSYDDLEFENSLKRVIKSTGESGATRVLSYHDWVWYLPKVRRVLQNAIEDRKPFKQFLTQIIEDHRSQFDPANDPTDYVFAFIKQQHNGEGQYFTGKNHFRSNKSNNYVKHYLQHEHCETQNIECQTEKIQP